MQLKISFPLGLIQGQNKQDLCIQFSSVLLKFFFSHWENQFQSKRKDYFNIIFIQTTDQQAMIIHLSKVF